MRCDQCQAAMINGIFCHETGCPNTKSRYDADSESWIKQRKCFECGCTVDADDECCNAETEDEDSEVYYYVSIRYNADESGAVSDFQIMDHGKDHAQYFQGCGVAFTSFKHVVTGCGNDAPEALEDALESLYQGDHTVTEAQEKEMLADLA